MKPETILNQRYHVLEMLGSGGMAVVYKARDLTLGRLVAIKVLRAALTTDPQFLRSFLQEARAVANLTHPNIVTVHDFGFDQEHYYIVMEFVEGQDLKTLIRSSSPLPVDEALDLAIQMCAGAGYAHRAGLVHCDIKPQNMLVTLGGRLKVTDFGLARVLATIHGDEKNEIVWGTPQYFAPEQAAGEATTPASDVYSLGIVIYEMLAGRLPFPGDSHKRLALAHLHEPPGPLAEINPAVPEALAHIVHKVLAKEPANRYRTADQLGRILLSYRNQTFRRTGDFSAGLTPPSGSSPVPVTQLPVPGPGNHDFIRSRAGGSELGHSPESKALAEPLDWLLVALAFLAFLAITGLIPFWVWIGFVYGWF